MIEPTADHLEAYPPSAEFAAAANGDASLYDRAATDREGFWHRGIPTWNQPAFTHHAEAAPAAHSADQELCCLVWSTVQAAI